MVFRAKESLATTRQGQQIKVQARNPMCLLCKAAHWLPRCEKLRKQSLEERTKFIPDKRLCINCLFPGHFVHLWISWKNL